MKVFGIDHLLAEACGAGDPSVLLVFSGRRHYVGLEKGLQMVPLRR
jgi:hypothetical protein